MLRLTLREGKPHSVTTPRGEVFELHLVRLTDTQARVVIDWGPPFQAADAACDEPCGPETIDENSPDS